MFVDASAIVAIMTREPEGELLSLVLDRAPLPVTSPIAVFETVLALCRKRHVSVEEAEQDVREFFRLCRIRVEPVDDVQGEAALAAFSRYGKGRGHPAQLNMGDCFAYAAARTRRTPLLFKGDDFSRTDARAAGQG